MLGHEGIELILTMLTAGRMPYPNAPWCPAFLPELVRHEPGEPLYVAWHASWVFSIGQR